MSRHVPYRLSVRALAIGAALVVAACASTPPVHLHTLMPIDAAPRVAATGPSVLLEPVSVPSAVDQPQWLVRMPDGTLARLENERWASNLSDELQAALIGALVERQGLVDARSPGAPAAQWRARVDVSRFETGSAGDTRLEGVWAVEPAVRASNGSSAPAGRCAFDLRENSGPGTPALADAHRRAVARLAETMAAAVRELARGGTFSCPT